MCTYIARTARNQSVPSRDMCVIGMNIVTVLSAINVYIIILLIKPLLHVYNSYNLCDQSLPSEHYQEYKSFLSFYGSFYMYVYTLDIVLTTVNYTLNNSAHCGT